MTGKSFMPKRPREKEKQQTLKLKVSCGNGLKANWNILSAFEKQSIRGRNVFWGFFCVERNKNLNTPLAKAECQSSVPV